MRYLSLISIFLLILSPYAQSQPMVGVCNKVLPYAIAGTRYCQQDMLVTVNESESSVVVEATYRLSLDSQFYKRVYRREAKKSELEERIQTQGYDYAHLASEKVILPSHAHRDIAINRVAMHPAINRKGGLWHHLEETEVLAAKKRGVIVVKSGAIYTTNDLVPTLFYKVLYHPASRAVDAYLVPNNEKVLALHTDDYRQSLACIENHTSMSLLPDQDSETRNLVSHGVAVSDNIWNSLNARKTACF